MKKLKQELLAAGQSWNFGGGYNGTEFAGRFFMSDMDLDKFARKHGLTQDNAPDNFDKDKVEKACKCKIVYDYKSANQDRQVGDQEIIFNRPGPQSKPEAEKAKVKNISFPAKMYKFICDQPSSSAYIQKCVNQDKDFQDSKSTGAC